MKRLVFVITLIALCCSFLYSQNLSSVEYFIDGDPGVGNGILIPVQSPDTGQLSFNVNTANLPNGLHTLLARAIDDSNQVSLTSTVDFVRLNEVAKHIDYLEYFIDGDPGVGNGIAIPLQPTTDTSVAFSVNTSALLSGLHSLYVRSLDDSQETSISAVFYFIKYPTTSTDLVYGEYFFDVDPGHHMANGFSITGSALANHIIPVSIPQLSSGFHNLFVRVKNEEAWSMTMTIPFVKVNQKDLSFSKGEYFVDVDPGPGLAIPFGAGSTNPSGIILQFSTAQLSLGAHKLFIRTQDSCGIWSLTSAIDFFKVIVENEFSLLEYFFDTDPGFGGGVLFELSGLDSAGIILSPNTSVLSNGLHTMSVRSRSQVGSWSHTKSFNFFKFSSGNEVLSGGEYFFNSNISPGEGTAFILPAVQDTYLIQSIDISALPNGINYLFYRTKNEWGAWSQVSVTPFVKSVNDAVHLVRMEYFIDVDPGFGQGISVQLPAVTDTSDVDILVNTSGLEPDYYKLFVRSYDSNNQWSTTAAIDFVKYCIDSISLIDVFIPDSFYQAGLNVRSNGTLNPVATTFKSIEIDLLPGFSVPLGVQFLAENADCPVDPASLKPVNSNTEDGETSDNCRCSSIPCVCPSHFVGQSLLETE